MSIRGAPTEISGDPHVLYPKVVENNFRGRGPSIDDFWPYFQTSIPKFGKNMFFCLIFASKFDFSRVFLGKLKRKSEK